MTSEQIIAIKSSAEQILKTSCKVRETIDGRVEIIPQIRTMPGRNHL